MLVFMRLSEKYAVPGELALLYDFVNTLDRRRYVEQGLVHAGGDELATPREMEAWMRRHRLLLPGKHINAAEHRQALYAPPPLLQRLVTAGLLGRKSGRGLYSYQ